MGENVTRLKRWKAVPVHRCTNLEVNSLHNMTNKSEKAINGIYGADKYDKRDRKEILRAKRAMRDNPVGRLRAKGIKVKISQENLSGNTGTGDLIETDYR